MNRNIPNTICDIQTIRRDCTLISTIVALLRELRVCNSQTQHSKQAYDSMIKTLLLSKTLAEADIQRLTKQITIELLQK